jgi:uncharacterized protein (TIGR02118 family)
MAKVIFVVHRKKGTTLEQMNAGWKGDSHASVVKKLPGLTKFVQNHVIGPPGTTPCDGIGELWFENDAVMEQALNSTEMDAAVESAKNFLDMEKTGLIIVREVSIK